MRLASIFKTRPRKALFFALSPLWFSPIAFGVMFLESATSQGGHASVGRGWAFVMILLIVYLGLIIPSLFYLIVIWFKDRPIKDKAELYKVYGTLSLFLAYPLIFLVRSGDVKDAILIFAYLIIFTILWVGFRKVVRKLLGTK